MKKIKKILNDTIARSNLKAGIHLAAGLIRPTLGAKGRKIIITKEYSTPQIIDDGAKILQELSQLEDPNQQFGVDLLKEVANRTNDQVGDGTTTSAILADALVQEIISEEDSLSLKESLNNLTTRREIETGLKKVLEYVDKNKIKVTDDKLYHVGKVSSNSEEIGKILAEFISKVGKEITITVSDNQTLGTSYEVVKGMQFSNGFISPYFINDRDKEKAILENPNVLVTNHKINNPQDWEVLVKLFKSGVNDLVIICDDLADLPLKAFIMNIMQGTVRAVAVKAPGLGNANEHLEDIATLTGAKFIDKGTTKFTEITSLMLGKADKVESTRNDTTIIGGKGKKEDIKTRIQTLITRAKAGELSAYDKEKVKERISKLTGGVGIIKVGAATDIEREEKKEKIDDAIHAVQAAVEDGIVPGGGVVLLRASSTLEDEGGEGILKRAILKPFEQIISNAGLSDRLGEIEASILKNPSLNYGYDVETEKFGDLIEMGIIDPAKVTKTALGNAVSIAKLAMDVSGAIVMHEVEDNEDKNE